MRKAIYDINGPLVYKRRYKDFYNKKSKIGNEQLWDGLLIQRCMAAKYSNQSGLYISEYRDYIEDFSDPKNAAKTKFSLQEVYWDHIVISPDGYVKLYESDDPSHFDKQYCDLHGWDYFDIQRRDKIKNTWASNLNYELIRLPHFLSDQQKIDLIMNSL